MNTYTDDEIVFLDKFTESDATDEKNKRKIGDNIRNLRRNRGFTQSDLAKKYGCSRQNLGTFENGTYENFLTSLKSLRKIATLLNVTLLKLMEGVVPTKIE